MYRQFLGERVPSFVFAHWRGRPLYIHIIFLLGQLLVTIPSFIVGNLFATFVTQVSWTAFILPVAIEQLLLIGLGAWLYFRFSRRIRRLLADLILGQPPGPSPAQATAAWLEATLFPQRVVGWVTVAIVVVVSVQTILFIPRFGLLATLQGGLVMVTVAFWFAMFIFLSYLEWAMRPIVLTVLALGAEPTLQDLGETRLRLRVKLYLRTLGLVIVPIVILGLFAYGQVVALGSNPIEILWPTGLVVILVSGSAALQGVLLVRSVINPLQELQRVIEEVGDGNLDVSVRPLTNDELTELGLHFNRMVWELKQNEELAAAFGRYVSPAVRDGILGGQIDLGGERREITILFTDIRGFTGWCERESPESVIQTLNVYYGFLVQALIRHGGTVTRYTGDGVLALFGAPLEDPDHALHAVEAVWEAATLLDKFNDIRSTVGAFELRTGFGIHTGSAVVGSIGTDARAEYTPIGDPANVASRIEGLNKELGTSILISEATYQQVEDHIIAGQRAKVMVKGRARSVQVVEMVGLRD